MIALVLRPPGIPKVAGPLACYHGDTEILIPLVVVSGNKVGLSRERPCVLNAFPKTGTGSEVVAPRQWIPGVHEAPVPVFG